jgi:polysaccharide biosynthesis transport protein
MRQKLYGLQMKEQELLSKYTEKNFLVQETRRQIKSAEALLHKEVPTRAEVTKGLNGAYEQTKNALVAEQANYAGLQTRSQALAATLTGIHKEILAFNDNEEKIAQLQREKEIKEANYKEYTKKLEQARIDSALETEKISNISIAQAATSPLKPSGPNGGTNLALGFLAAAFGAVGLSFMAESLDHSLKRPEDVEKRLQLPLLTTIPYLVEDGISAEPAADGALTIVPDARMRCGLLGEAGESYETLCHRLISEKGGASKTPQVIGVISCHYGEGVSTVAANLAACLATRSNERVLFVETNLMSPSAHTTFGINRTPGLTDIVAERSDFSASIKPSGRSNLDVIPSGLGDVTMSQLAESKEFSEMLDLSRSEYSYVVFDLPPVFKSHSALRLAGQTDGVVLVVGAEGVSWQIAQKAKERLQQANARVIGVVLNKRAYHIPEWLYRRL